MYLLFITPDCFPNQSFLIYFRLLPYFDGEHHIEEIMYLENMRRSQLVPIIDKFRPVLLITDHQDPRLSKFYQNVSL